MKKQNGITLIALIITIVVLMILAVVTINSVKDGGVITKAEEAADKYTQAQNNELAMLDSYVNEIEKSQQKIGEVKNQNGEALKIGDFIYYGDDLCVVLYNDDVEGLQILSTKILGEKTLSGVDGFENRIKYFKDACSSYINKSYGAIDARVPGYTFNEINNIVIKNTYELELDDGTTKTINCYGREDRSITTENDNLYTALASILTNGILTNNEDIWFTYYQTDQGLAYYVDYVTITSTGVSDNRAKLAEYLNGTKKLEEYDVTHKILPIVLLDQRINITSGDGSYGSPYVYELKK